MVILHFGPLQLDVRRRSSAGQMIPAIGQQDTANIQKAQEIAVVFSSTILSFAQPKEALRDLDTSISWIYTLEPVSRHLLLPGGDPASQDAPHQIRCRPSHNRCRNDQACQGRRVGRCRWETQHWRRSVALLREHRRQHRLHRAITYHARMLL